MLLALSSSSLPTTVRRVVPTSPSCLPGQSEGEASLTRISQRVVPWTTNAILWIRTAVRRFLTSPSEPSLSGFVVRCEAFDRAFGSGPDEDEHPVGVTFVQHRRSFGWVKSE